MQNFRDLEEEIKIPLVVTLPKIPTNKIIKYSSIAEKKRIVITIEELLRVIAKLFYREMDAIPTQKIAREFGLQKAERFSERVIQYHLVKDGKKGKKLINYIYDDKRMRRFYYPLAIVLKSQKNEVIVLAPQSYKNLQWASRKIEVNICKPPLRLSNFIELFKGVDEVKLFQNLVELAKSMESRSVYTQEALIRIISHRLLRDKVNEKTRDAT